MMFRISRTPTQVAHYLELERERREEEERRRQWRKMTEKMLDEEARRVEEVIRRKLELDSQLAREERKKRPFTPW